MMKNNILLLFVLSAMLLSCVSSSEIKNDPGSSFAHHYNLGLAAMEQQQFAEAVGHFRRSIELNPNIARTHNDLGVCYLYLNNNQEAVESFEKAIQLDPTLVEAHNSLGVAYKNMNRFREAELHFRTVLASNEYGTKFIPLYNLGNLYYQQKDYDVALRYYLEAMQEESKITMEYRISIYTQLGNTYFVKKFFKEALQNYEKVLVLNPRLQEAAYKAGVSAFNLNQHETARLMFSKVITIDPSSEMARLAQDYLNKLD